MKGRTGNPPIIIKPARSRLAQAAVVALLILTPSAIALLSLIVTGGTK